MQSNCEAVDHYAANNPVKYVDPTGMSLDDWQNNGDGTWTVKSQGATLWDVWGADWKEKSGFDRDPRTLQVGETVGKNAYAYAAYQNSKKARPLDTISEDKKPIAFSIGKGEKVALILGSGYEKGFIFDTKGNVYYYLSSSIGTGIQFPVTNKKCNPYGLQIGVILDPVQTGFSWSTTSDICVFINATYDLDNLRSSGIPNSFSFGNVGGGVWKTASLIIPIIKGGR